MRAPARTAKYRAFSTSLILFLLRDSENRGALGLTQIDGLAARSFSFRRRRRGGRRSRPSGGGCQRAGRGLRRRLDGSKKRVNFGQIPLCPSFCELVGK